MGMCSMQSCLPAKVKHCSERLNISTNPMSPSRGEIPCSAHVNNMQCAVKPRAQGSSLCGTSRERVVVDDRCRHAIGLQELEQPAGGDSGGQGSKVGGVDTDRKRSIQHRDTLCPIPPPSTNSNGNLSRVWRQRLVIRSLIWT